MSVLTNCFESYSRTNFYIGGSNIFEGTASNLLLYITTPYSLPINYTIEHNTGVIITENVQQNLVSNIPNVKYSSNHSNCYTFYIIYIINMYICSRTLTILYIYNCLFVIHLFLYINLFIFESFNIAKYKQEECIYMFSFCG